MQLHNIRYGGELKIGDLVFISYHNYLLPGFYCGRGLNSLQFYTINEILYRKERYDMSLDPKSSILVWEKDRYANGFTKKCLVKSYINSVGGTRLIKIENPKSVFTEQDDYEDYLKAKEILITLEIIKK